jgi:hypothetical protein
MVAANLEAVLQGDALGGASGRGQRHKSRHGRK